MTTEPNPIEPPFDDHDQALPLPGMEPAARNVPPLVAALRRTVFELVRDDVVAEIDALDLAAMQLLARSAEMKLATGRGSTIANDVELLLRTKRELIGEEGAEASVDDKLRAAMASWADAAQAAEGGPPPGDSS